jgi:hypothetical protein
VEVEVEVSGTVTDFESDDEVYRSVLGVNVAVNVLVPACKFTFVVAMPPLTGTVERAVPPVNITAPIAVLGVTAAVRVICCPTKPLVTDGVSVVVVRVVG